MAPGDGWGLTGEKSYRRPRTSLGHPLHPLVQSLSLNRLRPYGKYVKHGGRRSQVTLLFFAKKLLTSAFSPPSMTRKSRAGQDEAMVRASLLGGDCGRAGPRDQCGGRFLRRRHGPALEQVERKKADVGANLLRIDGSGGGASGGRKAGNRGDRVGGGPLGANESGSSKVSPWAAAEARLRNHSCVSTVGEICCPLVSYGA